MRERPPDCLLPESGAPGDDEDQVDARLKGYVKTHFKHQLWCCEQGLFDPYNASLV